MSALNKRRVMQLMETNGNKSNRYTWIYSNTGSGIVHIYTYVLNSVEAVLLYIVNEY